MTKPVSRNLFVALAAAAAIGGAEPAFTAASQEAKTPPAALARGIYVEAADGATETLEGAMPIDSRASGTMGAMFGKRPTVVLTLAGATAERKLTSPTPQFRVVLTPYKMSRTPEEMMAQGMNHGAPPPMIKQPKEFQLSKLAVKEDNRELDAKKAPRVNLSIEKIADNVYRLKPETALEPGEYAIYAVAAGQPASVLWDFSIGAPQ
jgi:hypothetical protein